MLEDLGEVDDDELRGRALGRMALLLTKYASEGQLWDRMPQWMATLRAVLSESGLRAVETVMRYVIEVEKGPPTPDLQRMLVEGVGPEPVETMMSWARQLREEGREEGREQGLRAGKEEAARSLLSRMITLRFGSVPDPVAQSIEQASLEQVEAWTDRILVAESAEDIVEDKG